MERPRSVPHTDQCFGNAHSGDGEPYVEISTPALSAPPPPFPLAVSPVARLASTCVSERPIPTGDAA